MRRGALRGLPIVRCVCGKHAGDCKDEYVTDDALVEEGMKRRDKKELCFIL